MLTISQLWEGNGPGDVGFRKWSLHSENEATFFFRLEKRGQIKWKMYEGKMSRFQKFIKFWICFCSGSNTWKTGDDSEMDWEEVCLQEWEFVPLPEDFGSNVIFILFKNTAKVLFPQKTYRRWKSFRKWKFLLFRTTPKLGCLRRFASNFDFREVVWIHSKSPLKISSLD